MAAQQHHADDLGAGGRDDESGESPVVLLKRAVFRFPLTIAGATAIGFVAAFAFAFSKPNTYRSEGTLRLRTGAREQLTPERAVDIQTNNERAITPIAEELDLMKDPSIAHRVVERIGADRILEPYDPLANDDENTPAVVRTVHELQAWLMSLGAGDESGDLDPTSPAALQQAATVVNANRQLFVIPQTDLISVSYTATDPELARDVATTYLSVLREVHQEAFASERIVEFVRAQLEGAETEAEQAQTALDERKTEDGVFDYDTAVTALEGEVRRLEEQYEEDRLQIEDLTERLATARRQLEEIDGQIAEVEAAAPTSEPEIAPLPVSSSALTLESTRALILAEEEAIAALADEYAKTSSRYTEMAAEHRAEIRRLEGVLESLVQIDRERDKALAERALRALPEEASVLNLLRGERSDLNSNSRAYQQELDGLEVIVAERRSTIEEKRAELEALRAQEAQYKALTDSLELAEEKVRERRAALARAEILELIGLDGGLLNLQVWRQPNVPQQKEGSSRLKLLVLGLIAGAGAGFALACGRLLMDPTLRYRGEIESLLGLPVVGVIPATRAWRAFGRSTRLRRSAS